MLIISETLQIMPCQASPHGSPPEAIQPGRIGAPSAANKPLIAATDSITTMLVNSQKTVEENLQIPPAIYTDLTCKFSENKLVNLGAKIGGCLGKERKKKVLTIVRVSSSQRDRRSPNQQRQEQRKKKKTVDLRTPVVLCDRSLSSHCCYKSEWSKRTRRCLGICKQPIKIE